MKRIAAILIIILAFRDKSMSQSSTWFSLGIKAGANLNKIDGMSFSQDFNLNYNLGVYIEIQLTKGFGIQPEVYFSQTTSLTTSRFDSIYYVLSSQNPQRTFRLNYLNIPILANVKLSKHLSLQIGPQYGILVNDHQNLVNNGKEAFKNGDFSMVGGLWFRLPLGFSIHARYLMGLNNLNDIDNQDNWKSQTIQIGLGVKL